VKEAAKNNWHEGMLIVEEWLLIEYAVGSNLTRRHKAAAYRRAIAVSMGAG
jgi:hypothetical protein